MSRGSIMDDKTFSFVYVIQLQRWRSRIIEAFQLTGDPLPHFGYPAQPAEEPDSIGFGDLAPLAEEPDSAAPLSQPANSQENRILLVFVIRL